jgi:hypothetical protein
MNWGALTILGGQDRHLLLDVDWDRHISSSDCPCDPEPDRMGGTSALRWVHRAYPRSPMPTRIAPSARRISVPANGSCPACGSPLTDGDVIAVGRERLMTCRSCGQEFYWTRPERPPTRGEPLDRD